MIYSMTGYGASSCTRTKQGTASIELKTLNSRYLDIRFTWPHAFHLYESAVREYIRNVITRGTVTVTVEYTPAETSQQSRIDTSCAAAYMRDIRATAKELDCAEDISMDTLLQLPGVVRDAATSVPVEDILPLLEKGFSSALKALNATRKAEGKAMAEDMRARLKTIEAACKEITKISPDAVQAYHTRLCERLDALKKKGIEYDATRVMTEIGIYSERLDINEECVRLRAHIAQIRATVRQGGVCGKRLDFILQEMYRETTTIGNKSSSSEISKAVVTIKEELEKMREMAQNIE